ncbi:hypothetical protein ACROYT_G018116 [Oculina patagonica]
MCIFYARRRQRTVRYGRVIVRQRVTATTVTTTGAIQSNPPHPGQVPPPVSYQQGYPPPQYEQQQHTANPPPPYNPGATTASEEPPPYTAAPQGPTINFNIRWYNHAIRKGELKAVDKKLNMAEFSFAILFKYAALVALIAYSSVSDAGCTTKSDCGVYQVCCNSACVDGSSCVGQSCSFAVDCASGESCCDYECVHGSSCVGHHCSSYFDCAGAICCNNKCKYASDCVGSSCSTDYDCGISTLKCCDEKCSYHSDCSDRNSARIIGSVVGTIFSISMVITCIAYACRHQRTLDHGRVPVRRRATATTVTTTGAVQGNPPYPGQVPPSVGYQPGYLYYLPPQGLQHQHTTNPPPFNPVMKTVNKQPPPSYFEATQQVSVPKTNCHININE